MIGDDTSRQRLDSLLCGLEDDVISLDDRELLSEGENGGADLGPIRSLIQSQTAAHLGPDASRVPGGHRHSATAEASSIRRSSSSQRRRILDKVLRRRPGVPLNVRLAFSADLEPTDRDDEMLEPRAQRGPDKADDDGC